MDIVKHVLQSEEMHVPLPEYVVPEGLPLAVFTNKYSRRKPDGTFQTWAERVREVVAGNFLLDPGMQSRENAYAYKHARADFERTVDLAVAGILPFSGRHLQHGDDTQPGRLLELFSNCSTTLFSFQLFRLLLRGSGVGRDYSSACCRVDWDRMPNIRLVLDSAHQDFRSVEFGGFLEPLRDARHKYDSESEDVRWFSVGDSREGWAKAIEILETATFHNKHADKLFVFDFSGVRPQGSPIHGLQGRPASGPVPLMNALSRIATLKGAGMKPWKQALFVDHYLAECVVWGGARRSARMATKSWRDRDVLEFIDIKRGDRSRDGGFLWSANNSILVDHEFWEQAAKPQHTYARRVFEAAVNAAYWDKTGEPGFINVDMLHADDSSIDTITGKTCIDPETYGDLHPRTMDMIGNVIDHVKKLPYHYIVNPCQPAFATVLTPFGISSIGAIKKGDKIWSEDGWVTVLDKWSRGLKQVYRYRTTAGVVYSTVNHRIVENGVKTEVQDAESIDILAGPTVAFNSWRDTAVMDGLVIGDGSVHRLSAEPVYLIIGENDQDYFSSEVSHLIAGDHAVKYGKAYKIATTLTPDELGLLPSRVIPSRYIESDARTAASFLRGLYSANGSVVTAGSAFRIVLKTTSSVLVEQVQTMLSALGFSSFFTTNKKTPIVWPNGTYESRESYDVNITGRYGQRFLDLIGFIQNYKVQKLKQAIEGIQKLRKVGKASYEISSVHDFSEMEVFDIHVSGPSHTYWSGCCNVSNCGEIVLSLWGGLCVHGDTRILHRKGYDKIRDLIGAEIEVFNGEEWSWTVPFQTGSEQPMLRVTLSDGSFGDFTYNHRFSVRNGRQNKVWSEKRTHELKHGDILPTFRTPSDITGNHVDDAYTYGVFLGDGYYENRSDKPGVMRFMIPLYKGKHGLPINGKKGGVGSNGAIDVSVHHLDHDMLMSLKGDYIPEWVFCMDRESTLEFLRGCVDSDGCFHDSTGGISFSTSREGHAYGVHLLLRRAGVSYASVRQTHDAGDITNYGVRENGLWMVYVPSSEAALLNAYRVATDYELDLNYMVKQPRVVSVEQLPGLHDTFCFTEPKRGMGVFGNMLTYQCIIGDTNLSRVTRKQDALDAVQLLTKFLIRCNRMKSEYSTEVKRTNRIGVALTGIHEFAWTMFSCTFDVLIDYYKYLDWDGVERPAWFSDPENRIMHTAHDFWMFIDQMRQEVEKTAANISAHWGMTIPHTVTTIKPSGTVSKACGMVTEGAHLPALAYYLRWTMYLKTDPDLADLKARGYPWKDVSDRYAGHEVVGFPTRLPIAELMGDAVTLAGEASIEDQYKWVRLLERFWLGAPAAGNQVSYTLKYDASKTSYLDFMAAVLEWQPKVRCCAVMPQDDWRASERQYGYVPEQPITREEYDALVASIAQPVAREGYDADALACESGACPVEPDINRP